MTYWLPCTFISILAAFLAAMPWSRPHPNHLFMLTLLASEIGDHSCLSSATLTLASSDLRERRPYVLSVRS